MIYDFFVPVGGDPVKKEELLRDNIRKTFFRHLESDNALLRDMKIAPVEFQWKVSGQQMMVRIKPDEVKADA